MKIISIQIAELAIPLIRPFITAVRRTEQVDDVVVMLKTDHGCIGYGSAAATPAITGDSKESIIAAIRTSLGPALIGRDIAELNGLLQMNHQAAVRNGSAKAAIDMALHDLFAQYCGLPLYKWLGGHHNTLNTCVTISVNAALVMAQDAMTLASQGYTILKIKLGLDPAEDIERLEAIRQAVGESVTLLVDANQGWTCDQALQVMHAAKQRHLNIALLEQPTSAADIGQLKRIRDQIDWPVIADESCFSPSDAMRIAQMNACDGINIKLMKSGGIANAQAIYAIANAAGMQVMVGCMLESPIGIAAMASFALSKPDIIYADLDPIALIRDNYVLGGARLSGNAIILSEKPGLGIEGFHDGLTFLGACD